MVNNKREAAQLKKLDGIKRTLHKNITRLSARKTPRSQLLITKAFSKPLLALDSLLAGSKVKVERKESKNTGFTTMCQPIDRVRTILGLAPDEFISRSSLTKWVCTHIKEQNLQDPNNKRLIVPDTTLSQLFGTSEPFTYTQQQSLINTCFVMYQKSEADRALQLLETRDPVSRAEVARWVSAYIRKNKLAGSDGTIKVQGNKLEALSQTDFNKADLGSLIDKLFD